MDDGRALGRVVLTGAYGLVGTAVRARLRAAGVKTLALTHGDPAGHADALRWHPERVPVVDDPARLEGWDAVVHLAGENVAAGRWTAERRRRIDESRGPATEHLCRTLAALERPPRVLVAASAIGIYGDRGDEVLTEDSPPGAGFLAGVARRWEEATRPAEAAGVRVVHLRFGVVLAAHGGALARMLPVFRMGLGGRLGSGRQWMSWISLEDAGRVVLAALAEASWRGAVNVVAPEPVTNAAFAEALGRALHRPAIAPAPAWALRLAFGAMADEALLASERVRPLRLEQAGFRWEHSTLEPALAALLSGPGGDGTP